MFNSFHEPPATPPPTMAEITAIHPHTGQAIPVYERSSEVLQHARMSQDREAYVICLPYTWEQEFFATPIEVLSKNGDLLATYLVINVDHAMA
jgi:hypothetical protein